jgi:eight-cysteine-cluster-containing protein
MDVVKNLRIFFICALLCIAACKPGNSIVAQNKVKDFCGISSEGACKENTDCEAGGCSGQVCYAKSEGAPITTCEYKDCFNAKNFGMECRCVDDKCVWK